MLGVARNLIPYKVLKFCERSGGAALRHMDGTGIGVTDLCEETAQCEISFQTVQLIVLM